MFAALFNFDGAPLAVPGVEGLQRQVLGASGQAALLHLPSELGRLTGEETGIECLADRYWLVGRMRLDDRERLRARLASRLGPDGPVVTDAGLCLHAYAAWGEGCVDHLAGDFAFVVWDEARQCLFAAGDRLGKRTLFHARVGALGLIGDSLDWIAQQGGGRAGLDEYWIADFLTLSWSREFHRTVYRDVSRLAPGHSLVWSAAGARLSRYWRLEVPEPLYLDRPGAYTERFRDLLALAVADRLPRGKVGIAMSGGLDSTALAAVTVSCTSDPRRVIAHCEHYEDLMHIEEDRFATMAARHLGIDLSIERFDDMAYDPQWQSRGIRSAEPTPEIVNAACVRDINLGLSRRATVWLEGEGPDNALAFDRDAYLAWLFRRRSWRRLFGAVFDYAAVKGVGGWTQTLKRRFVRPRDPVDAPVLPPWLNPAFVERLRLVERCRDLGEGGDTSHPWHPGAMASFTSPIWTDAFTGYDFQESLAPVCWRHPFLDLRVLHFMLSVPPVPWAWKKDLIRKAMRGRLPKPVVERPKTPLAINVRAELVRRHGSPAFLGQADVGAYVEPGSLPSLDAPPNVLMQSVNAYVLGHWMASVPLPAAGPKLYTPVYCG